MGIRNRATLSPPPQVARLNCRSLYFQGGLASPTGTCDKHTWLRASRTAHPGVSILHPLDPSGAEVTQRGRRKCRAVLCDPLCAEWSLDPERYRYVDRNRVFRVSPAVACSRRGVGQGEGCSGGRRRGLRDGGCGLEALSGLAPFLVGRQESSHGAGSLEPVGPGVGLCKGTRSRPDCCVFLYQPPLRRRSRCAASPPACLFLLVQALVTLKARLLLQSDQTQCRVLLWFATCR